MKTIAQSYLNNEDCNMSSNQLVNIAREEMADLYSNSERSWVEFCDGSILDLELGKVKAFRKLQRFHTKGVGW